MDSFEKRWQRIHDMLIASATGAPEPKIRSMKTLFGIRSSVEQKMDEFARQIEEEQARLHKQKQVGEAAGISRHSSGRKQ